MNDTVTDGVKALSYEDMLELYAEQGGERAAARFLGVARTTLQAHFYKLKAARFVTQKSPPPIEHHPSQLGVRTFILSSAQDATAIHKPFLVNLEAYAAKLGSMLMISGFTYNKTLFESHDKHHSWYPHEIAPYLTQKRVNLGPGLTFCGEMNTLPTAVVPLSGFETYTRDRWGIFPHPKIHLTSIPTAKGDPAKIIMTTGTVSLPNYVQKKAGIKAEFNHEIGAVIVELMPDGTFFCRHLLAEEDGSFNDLNTRVTKGQVLGKGDQIEAVTWGDVHFEKIDRGIAGAIWGDTNVSKAPGFIPMIDFLQPNYQFIHDVIDFKPRNHHNIKDPHFRYQMHVKGTDSVEQSLTEAANFLSHTQRFGTTTIIVESNHDLALLKWLKTADYREDPVNALFFLTLQKRIYEAITDGDDHFQVLPWAMGELNNRLLDCLFLSEDDSFTVAGGIECGMHGHNGANGTPGNSRQFAKMGKRSNTGHTHSATIFDGSYIAGVSGSLDMGYNKGLSSWTHSHIVTYSNGKRTIITQNPDTGLYCAAVSGMPYVEPLIGQLSSSQ